MSVIMFEPQFHDAIRAGTKRTTIRPRRKRKFKKAEALSLRGWSGRPYGSKQFVVAEATYFHDEPITVEETGITIDGKSVYPGDLERIAQDDGFKNWPEMLAWFRDTHGLPFSGGDLIHWNLKPTTPTKDTKQ